ncbi:MAG TPA: hypothetical protein VNL96_01110 [Gemmatimonadaceae bacterium]|nr:hypothetical protein [Gemmatimonadaceae bacterium]
MEEAVGIGAEMDSLAAAIPNARIHALAGHGHMTHATHPETIATIVRAFMA